MTPGVNLPVTITGWGTSVPDTRVTNADLELRVDTTDEWIIERTGIRERRIANDDETTATLGTAAAAQAIKRAGLTPSDIDLLIVATSTPEQPMPHTGAYIGEALGLHCGSFDLSAACAGFVYELIVGASMVHSGYDHVLIVGSETMSRIVDPDDRATVVLFGDGAGAAVLSRTAEEPGMLAWDMGCDGSAASILEVPAGGSRKPASAATVAGGEHYMKMVGQEVFRRAVRAVVDSTTATMDRAHITADKLDWFVPHQANTRIIDAAATRLHLAPERTIVNIDKYGNTSAASIPLALFEAVDEGRVQTGDLVLCSGFGAGMAWASALVRWGAR